MAKAIFNAFADPHDEKYSDYLFTFNEVVTAILQNKSFKTNIMQEMCSCWERDIFSVHLVDYNGNEYEVSNESNLTMKELRPAHNIYKMWRAGSFCDVSKDRDFRFKPEYYELEEVKKYNEMICKLIEQQEKDAAEWRATNEV